MYRLPQAGVLKLFYSVTLMITYENFATLLHYMATHNLLKKFIKHYKKVILMIKLSQHKVLRLFLTFGDPQMGPIV